MLLSGNHHKTKQFYILKSRHLLLILGYPWLCHHNPHIDWATGSILSSSYHQVCLRPADAPLPPTSSNSAPDLSEEPAKYHDFRGSLPPCPLIGPKTLLQTS